MKLSHNWNNWGIFLFRYSFSVRYINDIMWHLLVCSINDSCPSLAWMKCVVTSTHVTWWGGKRTEKKTSYEWCNCMFLKTTIWSWYELSFYKGCFVWFMLIKIVIFVQLCLFRIPSKSRVCIRAIVNLPWPHSHG